MKIVKRLFICVWLVMIVNVSVPRSASAGERLFHIVDGVRFYWALAAGMTGSGTPVIVAVGQKDWKDEGYRGYVAIFSINGTRLELVAEEPFSIRRKGRELYARCRSAAAVCDPVTGKWRLYSAGRGGTDETGIGFLRYWVFSGKELNAVQTVTFQQPAGKYTHGYPLKAADVTGDDRLEVIYGGFSGEKEVDYADVRIFRADSSGKLAESDLKPFAELPIPLRVNALEVADIDGDKKAEIVIAGRTRSHGAGDGEKAAFAWWSGGKVFYKVIETPTPGRLRTLFIADLDGSGKPELLTGGRLELGEKSAAFITAWDIKDNKAVKYSSYTWSLGGAARLRTLVSSGRPGYFAAGGRCEAWNGSDFQWEGFIGEFIFEKGKILPFRAPFFLKKGLETRIRCLESLGSGKYLASGFVLDAQKSSSGFVSVYAFDE